MTVNEAPQRPIASVAMLYPPRVVEQLVAAAGRRDEVAIDHITDQLASMGLARPRTCTRLFPASLAAESRRSST